jgi:hypothetical protein
MIGLTPTTQRVEGFPYGECVRASYAAILDRPIEMIPRFDPAVLGGEAQIDRERRWLRSIGLDLQEIFVPPGLAPSALPQVVPPIEHLVSGLSPRGFGHRCVGFGGRVVWDPHPSRMGLTQIYTLGFLLPLKEFADGYNH